jgi:hypothetical protein
VATCDRCQGGWQDGAGQAIEVSEAVIDQARCDATSIGRVDGAAPAPVTASIPRRVRNQMMRRDHHRCVVPGCRSSRHLEVHHLDPRAQGGGNDPANLVVLCGGHHTALHRGRLVITGRPGALGFAHADGRPWGAPPPAPGPPFLDELRQGLRRLGLTPAEARAAVEAAHAHVGAGDPPEAWVRAALAAYGETRRHSR